MLLPPMNRLDKRRREKTTKPPQKERKKKEKTKSTFLLLHLHGRLGGPFLLRHSNLRLTSLFPLGGHGSLIWFLRPLALLPPLWGWPQSGGHAQPEALLPESRLRWIDVDDSDCDHPIGDSRASGNESSGSDSDNDSDVEMTNAEELDLEEAVFGRSALEMLLMRSQQPGVFEEATFLYQRCPDPSLRTVQRKEKGAKELQNAAEGSKKIYTYFQNPRADARNSAGRPNARFSSDQRRSIERQDAIKGHDKSFAKGSY